MSSFLIQPLTEADLPEVYSLACATAELQIEANQSEFFSIKRLTQWLQSPDDLLLAVRSQGELAAFALVIYHTYSKEAYLSDLVIAPKFRQNGLATKLFDYIEQELAARGCESVWGIVQNTNGKMQNLLRGRRYRIGNLPFVYIHKDL